ncbi:bifunctional lytic transglycosylase/C40 family peptidase [Kribbella sp. NPDC023972]|uniref:C40 family peptidase n=1 Tax=Kribbella sp. NPDC023972 TaxID=3154795 RepID=UPI00340E758A
MKKLIVAGGIAAVAGIAVVGFVGLSMLTILLGRGSIAEAKPPGDVPGVSPILLKAYQQAVEGAAKTLPNCHGLRWQILAGIAQIESNNAAGHAISEAGDVTPPIIGPALDGSGAGGNLTPVNDTDQGVWDRDTNFDRAVGVLQFIPSSWRVYGRDGNNDSIKDPHNVFDNAAGAVVHLCGTGDKDFSTPETLRQALYGYNQSWSYVSKVTEAIATFDVSAPTADLPPGSPKGAVIVAAAMKWVGTPYSWGGGNASGPSTGICCSPGGSDGRKTTGFDCSGLSTYAAAQIGINLPRTAAAQSLLQQQIPASAGVAALQPGDLVFFGFIPGSRTGIHHVGIYVGNGQMVNAPRPGTQVRVEPIWSDSYAGAVRLA